MSTQEKETTSFEEMLDKHGYLVYTNVGISMMPLLRQGKDVMEIRKKGSERCKKYDAVLYKVNDRYILTRSTKERLEELEATRDDLENKIALEKLSKPRISEDFMRFWLYRFRKLDVKQKSHRKMLIDTFINAVFLYDDKLVITFNLKEGTKTITFGDLKEAENKGVGGSDLDSVGALKKSTCLGRCFFILI